MQDAAICLFAWDLADEGIDPILEFAADAGLTSIYLASVYHAGWFILPHNPRQTCYMPEDGVAYFHANPQFFDDTPLKPRVAHVAESTDWFAEVSKRLDLYGLKLTAWTVCNHNTRLGRAYPEHTVRNALGDSYPHALTPGSTAVRDYVRGLARNLASQYPLQSIFLEAPNYRGRRHGHHHERDLTPFGDLENELLDVSFSPQDIASAAAEGIDGELVRQAVAKHLTSYLASVPYRPHGMPITMEQFCNECPILPIYRTVLERIVSSLVTEIHDDVASHGVALEGIEPIAAYDWQVLGAYGKTPEHVAELTRAGRSHAAAHQRLRVGFRLGFDPPDEPHAISSAKRCRECIQAAAENGADAIYFYNYSESPRTYLSWIKPSIKGLFGSAVLGHRCTTADKEGL
jgi:hypothetical protein